MPSFVVVPFVVFLKKNKKSVFTKQENTRVPLCTGGAIAVVACAFFLFCMNEIRNPLIYVFLSFGRVPLDDLSPQGGKSAGKISLAVGDAHGDGPKKKRGMPRPRRSRRDCVINSCDKSTGQPKKKRKRKETPQKGARWQPSTDKKNEILPAKQKTNGRKANVPLARKKHARLNRASSDPVPGRAAAHFFLFLLFFSSLWRVGLSGSLFFGQRGDSARAEILGARAKTHRDFTFLNIGTVKSGTK